MSRNRIRYTAAGGTPSARQQQKQKRRVCSWWRRGLCCGWWLPGRHEPAFRDALGPEPGHHERRGPDKLWQWPGPSSDSRTRPLVIPEAIGPRDAQPVPAAAIYRADPYNGAGGGHGKQLYLSTAAAKQLENGHSHAQPKKGQSKYMEQFCICGSGRRQRRDQKLERSRKAGETGKAGGSPTEEWSTVSSHGGLPPAGDTVAAQTYNVYTLDAQAKDDGPVRKLEHCLARRLL